MASPNLVPHDEPDSVVLRRGRNATRTRRCSGKAKKRRSGCPVSISLETIGDRWSLLIIRDLMVRGFRTFKDFQQSGEGIATNILADRLQRLEAKGIIVAETEKTDARRMNYMLTRKGVDLAPVLLELLIWGAQHEQTGVPRGLILKMEKNRDAFLAEVRRRWRERDPTQLIPKFGRRSGFGPQGIKHKEGMRDEQGKSTSWNA